MVMEIHSVPVVASIAPTESLTSRLQDALYNVIQQERFDELTVCQVVGVLEFLKWNFINRT
jgi:hypothetical protein